MREGCKSSGASEARGSGAGERPREGSPTGVGQRGEGVIRKGKRISREDATDAWAGWAGWDCFSLRGRCGRWAGWARGRTGHKVGRAEWKEK
jgi:hypothetical protein